MKSIQINAIVLTILIFAQSCTLYKAPTSLEQAAVETTKTKVYTNTGKKLRYKYITNENGTFYGVKKIKGELEKVPIDTESIQKVKVKDKTASLIATVLFPLAIIGLGVVLIGDAFSWKSDSFDLSF